MTNPATAQTPAKPLTSRTTYAELTPEQRERFGRAVKWQEDRMAELKALSAGQERAADALRRSGGSHALALRLLIAEGR